MLAKWKTDVVHGTGVTCLNRGLVEVSQVRGRLPWFMSQDHHVGIDQSEGINHHLEGKKNKTNKPQFA